MMKINTCLLTFLVTVMLFVGSHTNLKGIDAADQEYAAICAGCHPTLTETLPKGHAVIDTAKGHAVIEDTNPIFCKKCHSNPGSTKTFEWLIHFKHYSVAGDEIDCEVCHILGKEEKNGPHKRKTPQTMLPASIVRRWKPYFKSWANSGYMDNEHAQKGISCSPCHGATFTFEIPSLEKCVTCHKTYDIAAAQSNNEIPNPHLSHLESPPCALCHKAHEESINYCNNNNCHDFNFKFPYPNTK